MKKQKQLLQKLKRKLAAQMQQMQQPRQQLQPQLKKVSKRLNLRLQISPILNHSFEYELKSNHSLLKINKIFEILL